MEAAVQFARGAVGEALDRVLFDAYKACADTADLELGRVTDTDFLHPGWRGAMPRCCWRPVVDGAGTARPDRPEQRVKADSSDLAWMEARGRELAKTARRLGRCQGAHGRPQFKALCSELEKAWVLFRKEFCSAYVLEGHLAEFEVLLARANDWRVQPSDDLHVLSVVEALAHQLAASCAQAAEAARAQEHQEARALWHKWVVESLDAGASALHKWTKEPELWVPAEAALTEDHLANAPLAEFAAEREKWKGVWDADDEGGGQLRLAHGESLPRLTASQLRCASKDFSDHTSSTVDGFHPRQFSLLSDECLSCLGALLEAIEIGGVMPPQVRMTLVALIAKLTGGHRPIGIFLALHRLGGKARREVCAAWEAKHERYGRLTLDKPQN